jgi:hypothetical protein
MLRCRPPSRSFPGRRTLALLLLALSASGTPGGLRSAPAAADSVAPIRPGVPGVTPFWNENAKQFMVAPSFDFKRVPGATSYRFTVTAADGTTRTFEAAVPHASLAPIWAQVPVGLAHLVVDGLRHAGGESFGRAGERSFHRAAEFHGPYGAPLLPYGESAALALRGLIHEPFVQSWRNTGRPDPSYALYRYAAKLMGSLLTACARYAGQTPRPADAAEALAIGGRIADFLIGISGPPGTPLEYCPPTYHGAKPTERENDQWTMLISPAEAGQGYLDLHEATREPRFLEAARRIAVTYGKLQRPDGTWDLKVDNRTGHSLATIDLIPSVVISFLDRLVSDYEFAPAEPTLRRAVGWMMAQPVRTFNWQAQFDDAKLRGPYQNLSKHEACEFAGYLFRHAEGDAGRVALAREILRFAEDQFVVWEHPPELGQKGKMATAHWFTPCSLEQYAMFEPISGSSAFMIMTYVRGFAATGDRLYLAKAESLGNALTAAQRHHGGRFPTRMVREDAAYWANSTVNTIRALQMLAAAQTAPP